MASFTFSPTIDQSPLASLIFLPTNMHQVFKELNLLQYENAFIEAGHMTANGFFSLSLTLKGNTNITSLDLRRNKIGLKGISTLASVLKSFTCNIQYLDLDSTGMDDRCFVVLAQALSQRFTRSRLPPAVALAAAKEEDVAAAAAAADGDGGASTKVEGTKAEEITTSSTTTMEPETTETKKKGKKKKKKKEDEESIIIPTPCRLKELHLGHNMISDASNQALDVVMDSLPQLTHLDLSWNRLKAGTAAILAQRISDTRCSLKVLNLQFNRVGNMGASLLLQPLCRTPAPSLELLDLSFNGVVLEGDVLVDVIEVVSISRSKKLKSLQMNGNELLDEEFQTIKNALVESTKRRGGGGGSGIESSTSLVVGLESSAVAIVSMDH